MSIWKGVISRRILRATIVFVGTVNVTLLSGYVCRLVNRAGCFAESPGASASVKADGFLHIAALIFDNAEYIANTVQTRYS